jgi:hypothetical protein
LEWEEETASGSVLRLEWELQLVWESELELESESLELGLDSASGTVSGWARNCP